MNITELCMYVYMYMLICMHIDGQMFDYHYKSIFLYLPTRLI